MSMYKLYAVLARLWCSLLSRSFWFRVLSNETLHMESLVICDLYMESPGKGKYRKQGSRKWEDPERLRMTSDPSALPAPFVRPLQLLVTTCHH